MCESWNVRLEVFEMGNVRRWREGKQESGVDDEVTTSGT
jgi:hypothetical protein